MNIILLLNHHGHVSVTLQGGVIKLISLIEVLMLMLLINCTYLINARNTEHGTRNTEHGTGVTFRLYQTFWILISS